MPLYPQPGNEELHKRRPKMVVKHWEIENDENCKKQQSAVNMVIFKVIETMIKSGFFIKNKGE